MSIITATNRRLEQTLRASTVLPPQISHIRDAIDHAAQRAEQHNLWLGCQLCEDGILSGDELAQIISSEFKVPLIDLSTCRPDPGALALLDEAFCQRQYVLPISVSDQGLLLAMANPVDAELIEAVKARAGCQVAIAITALDVLARAIPEFYHQAAQTPSAPCVSESVPHELEIYRHRGAVQHTESDETPYPLSLYDLLMEVSRLHGSDLHLTAGAMPLIRVHGKLTRVGAHKLKPHHVAAMATSLMTPEQLEQFERDKELDFSIGVKDLGRFRGNVYMQRGSIGMILRAIPSLIPTLEQLRMPQVLYSFVSLERGLVLVTGPTGSGKSTTLAAIIDEMNRTRESHIVTLEDPIEYVHWHNKCEINQRQVGMDTKSFLDALKHVLRQDPDVILIGELRDLETISAAMTAAETGHLVFATLHTNSAAQTIDRIVDVFPANQQPQIRMQLANVIQGVVSQILIPKKDGKGRVCAQEILIATPAVRTLIRDGKTHQLPSLLESGIQFGMQTMDRALKSLLEREIISLDYAMRHSADPDAFKR